MLFELDAYHRLTKSYLVLSAPVAAPGRPIFVGEMAVGRVANASKNFLAFAQVAQVPPHLPRRLRKLRKFRGIFRDVCAGCASTTAFAETFAQAAQVARHLPRRLRRLRKFRRIYRGVCGSPASASKNFLAFAGIPQAFPKALWPLPHAINDILYG